MDFQKAMKSLIKAEHAHKRVLEAIFVLYIVFDIETPKTLAKMVDSTIGNVVVAVLALTMFAAGGPIAGILALIAGHTLIRRSSEQTGSLYLQGEDRAEHIKKELLDKYNAFPRTLEEDMVSQMAPLVSGSADDSNVKPVLDSINDAAPIDYDGVI
jgi:hypothetical protein